MLHHVEPSRHLPAVPLFLIGAQVGGTVADAQTFTDGDTIKFGKDRVRLWGIDAPEIHQTCPDRWLTGIEASRKLSELMKGRTLTCENRGYDRYGRMIGLCRGDGEDLSATMVRTGMA